MKRNDIDVKHVSRLARIDLTPEEEAKFSSQFHTILEYIDKLSSVNLDGVEPTSHVLKLRNILRADEVKQSIDTDSALRNAPDREGDFFKVPKVIENE